GLPSAMRRITDIPGHGPFDLPSGLRLKGGLLADLMEGPVALALSESTDSDEGEKLFNELWYSLFPELAPEQQVEPEELGLLHPPASRQLNDQSSTSTSAVAPPASVVV